MFKWECNILATYNELYGSRDIRNIIRTLDSLTKDINLARLFEIQKFVANEKFLNVKAYLRLSERAAALRRIVEDTKAE